MSEPKRVVNPNLLPHPRPCQCDECTREYHKLWWGMNGDRYKVNYLHDCIMCGKRFTTTNRTSSHCSGKCRGASVVRIGYCIELNCGNVYRVQGKRRRCELHVKRQWTPGRTRSETCRGCLTQFMPQPNRRTQVCCSKACWDDLKLQMRWFGRWNACELPLCCICDKPTGKGRGSVVCDKCRTRQKTESDMASGADSLKRAKRRSALHDGDPGITVVALRNRDGDHCRYCGFKIDFDAAQYEDLAPEVDHVVPLAAGGTHTWDNVQLLHGQCNRAKGARLIPDRPTLFDEGIA